MAYPIDGETGGLLGNFNMNNPELLQGLMLLTAKRGQTPGLLQGIAQMSEQRKQWAMQERRQQRADSAAEMQQLFGTYKLLKDQDQQARAESQFSGQPYQQHPGLQQIEQRLMTLTSSPPMAGGSRPPAGGLLTYQAKRVDSGQNADGPPGQNWAPPPLPGIPGGSALADPMGALRSLPPVGTGTLSPNPEENNGPAYSKVREATAQKQSQSQGSPQQVAQLAQAARAAGIPDQVSIGLIQQGQVGELYKLIAKAMAPNNGPGGISRLNPVTGAVEMLGGNASPGQVPWTLRNGIPTAQPIQGAAEEVARAEGLKAGAVERAKAPFNFSNYPIGPSGAPQILSTQELMRREQGQAQGSRNPVPPGYNGRSPDANARAILAQELQANPNDPHLRREIELRFPDLLQQRGGGLTGPNPLEVKATEALNDDFVKNGYRPIMDAAKSADTVLARVSALQRSGMLSKSGWGATQKAYAANLLGAFGVKDAQSFAADAQTFQKFIMDTNWELLNQAKGPQTEGDANRALKTFAQWENTPNANRFILDFTAATAKLVKEKAAFVSRETKARRGDLQGIEQAWYEQNRSVWDMPELQKWSGDKVGAAIGPKQVQLPDGKVANFPSEAAANAFRKELERR